MNRPVTMPSVVRRVGLMGATFGTGNSGVGALAMGSLRCIFRAFPDARVSFLDYGTAAESEKCIIEGTPRLIAPINLRFSIKIFLANNIAVLIPWALLTSWIPGARFKKFLRRRNRALRTMIDQDIFFSIAGGDSFSDIYGIERFLYVALPQLLCILLDKPVVQLPQTIGPFKRKWVAAAAGFIMRCSFVVFSRDREGCVLAAERIGRGVGENQVRFCPDVAFAMEPRQPVHLPEILKTGKSLRALVGLNVSGLLWMGGYNGGNMFGLKFPYREFVLRLITRFVSCQHADVLLVPHVFGEDNYESDSAACARIYDELPVELRKNVVLLEDDYSPGELKYLIGRGDFFVGARMHACIAALSQSVPAVGIAYSRKFKGVFAALDAEALVVDPRLLTNEMALDTCETLFSERRKWHDHLSSRVPAVIEEVLGMLKGLDSQRKST